MTPSGLLGMTDLIIDMALVTTVQLMLLWPHGPFTQNKRYRQIWHLSLGVSDATPTKQGISSEPDDPVWGIHSPSSLTESAPSIISLGRALHSWLSLPKILSAPQNALQTSHQLSLSMPIALCGLRVCMLFSLPVMHIPISLLNTQTH